MMRLADVGLVYGKELRETLRDRRTISVMVLFPLVVYPLVSLLVAQIVAMKEARGEATPSRVAIVGAATVTAAIRSAVERAPKKLTLRDHGDRKAIEQGQLDALVEVVPLPAPRAPEAQIVFDETRDDSSRARDRLEQVLAEVANPRCAPVLTVAHQSIAPRAKVGGYMLSKILPLILVVMVMLGAFYPAVDVTAGERERGTLETILSSPVARFDLMTGKVLAVATLATATGILNIASMSATMLAGARMLGATQAITIPWTRAALTIVTVVPSAFLFGAVMVAVGTMARSFKEAQNLLTPVYFLCLMPSLVAGLGEYPLAGPVLLVPGANLTLLARDLMVGQAHLGAVVIVVASTLLFGALALALAARLYDSERLLEADDTALPLRAWLRRLLGRGDGAPAPTVGDDTGTNAGHALLLFAVAYVLLFFVFMPLQKRSLVPGLLITEWIGILGLVILYARATGQPVVQVLRLRRPSARAVLAAVLIGGSAWMVLGFLAEWVLPVPKEVVESLRRAVAPPDQSRGLLASLLIMAVTPAICEEALFRGPILRGLARRLRPVEAAVATGLLFGLYHVDVWRVLPTGLLGVVLSLLALSSGSIVPAMLAHLINNSVLVALTHLGLDEAAIHLGWTAQVGLFAGATCVLALGFMLMRGSNLDRRVERDAPL